MDRKEPKAHEFAVLGGRQQFLVHHVFKTDWSNSAWYFLYYLFTSHDASVKRCKKGKKGLESLFFSLKNLVALLKSPVARAYVDCTAYAPCKRLCVEYTTFALIAT